MGVETAIAAVGVLASVVSTVQQSKEQQKAVDEQKKAEKARRQLAEQQAARERRQQVRQARIQRAQIIAGAETGGVTGSSGAIGGAGSVLSQASGNIAFQQAQLGGQRKISQFNQNAANAQSNASTAAAFGGIAQQVADDFGGYKTIFKAFG